MKIDLKKLEILKEKIKTAKVFNEPMIYFFDHFADHREFIEMSMETTDEILDKILIGIGQQFFKKQKINIQHKLFLTIKGHNVIHGPVQIEHRMMSFVYFTDIQLGVFAMNIPPNTMFGRMSAMDIKNVAIPPDSNLN